jgi:hypothetical protein
VGLFADQRTTLDLTSSDVYDKGVLHLCLTPKG